MKADKKAVGDRIKQIRLEKGFTLQTFGVEISKNLNAEPVKEGIISRWENGISLPNNERLKAIAEMGNVSVDDLLHGSSSGKDTLLNKLDEKYQDLKHIQAVLDFTESEELFGSPLHGLVDELVQVTIDNIDTIKETNHSFYVYSGRIYAAVNDVAQLTNKDVSFPCEGLEASVMKNDEVVTQTTLNNKQDLVQIIKIYYSEDTTIRLTNLFKGISKQSNQILEDIYIKAV